MAQRIGKFETQRDLLLAKDGGVKSSCEIHGLPMEKANVPVILGKVVRLDAEYRMAELLEFPNAAIPQFYAKEKGPVRVLTAVCKECTRLREEWLKSGKMESSGDDGEE